MEIHVQYSTLINKDHITHHDFKHKTTESDFKSKNVEIGHSSSLSRAITNLKSSPEYDNPVNLRLKAS